MGIIIIGFALFIIVAVVIGIVIAGTSGASGRRDYDSNPAFWNNTSDNPHHTQGTSGSSTADSDSHRLHQQSDHSPSHESQHSWGGDSGSSDSGSFGGSDGGGSSGGDGGSSSSS